MTSATDWMEPQSAQTSKSEAQMADTSWMEPGVIPAHWGYRPSRPSLGAQERRVTTSKVIRRDEGLVQALTLPTITVYNMRSIWAKINHLGDDINMRGTDLTFLTEIWQKEENKRHSFAIEEMLEMKGIKYISTPRPGAKRGGWCSYSISRRKVPSYKTQYRNHETIRMSICTSKTNRPG